LAKQKTPPEAPQPTLATASLEAISTREDENGSTFVPRKIIDWNKVEAGMMVGADLKTCAMLGGVHWNTLERRIHERYGEGFREVRAAFLTDRKLMALKAMWNQVAKGNWRAVRFANVVFNGLNDRPKEIDDDDHADAGTFKLAYNLDEEPPKSVEAEFEVQGD
jgi:hypothetical protein